MRDSNKVLSAFNDAHYQVHEYVGKGQVFGFPNVELCLAENNHVEGNAVRKVTRLGNTRISTTLSKF